MIEFGALNIIVPIPMLIISNFGRSRFHEKCLTLENDIESLGEREKDKIGQNDRNSGEREN